MEKVMKSLIIATVLVFATSISQAQSGQRGGNTVTPGTHSLVFQDLGELNLSTEQKKDLAELMMQRRSENRNNLGRQRPNQRKSGNARSNRGDNNRVSVEKRHEMRTETHNKVMDILTDEQAQVLREKTVERAETFREFRMLQHELALDKAGVSEDKKAQVLALFREHGQAMMDTRGDVESGARDGRDVFGERTELLNSLKGILTVEEFNKVRQSMGIRRAEPRRGNRSRNR